MADVEMRFDPAQLASLELAIARNPQKVREETARFLTQGIAVYNRGILGSPWRVGNSGGGAPVATGNLRDTHRREVAPFEARIYPTAPYARFIHSGTRRMTGRPWLDYVRETSDRAIRTLEEELLTNVTQALV